VKVTPSNIPVATTEVTANGLGVGLVPSPTVEANAAAVGGMRYASARRYGNDDSTATLIIVSEGGPVTLLRNGVSW